MKIIREHYDKNRAFVFTYWRYKNSPKAMCTAQPRTGQELASKASKLASILQAPRYAEQSFLNPVLFASPEPGNFISCSEKPDARLEFRFSGGKCLYRSWCLYRWICCWQSKHILPYLGKSWPCPRYRCLWSSLVNVFTKGVCWKKALRFSHVLWMVLLLQ